MERRLAPELIEINDSSEAIGPLAKIKTLA
jgi:hypothetical protein